MRQMFAERPPIRRARAICGALLGFVLLAEPAIAGQQKRMPEDINDLKALYKRPETIPFPPDNPFTREKAELGHTLFFDPRLSGPGTMSCATCHNPSFSWGDGLAVGVGSDAAKLARRSPSILNLAWAEALMWDG
ncbi:MAG: cytochrome c peroxidase, partial [Acetobacteraceae bacterium]